MTLQRVAFIGLGDMGAPMAANVCRAGFPLIVVARRPEVRAEFVALGATPAASPREAAEHAEVVISIVRDDQQTEEVMFGEQGILAGCRPGTTLIVMSTIQVRLVRALAGEAERRGATLLDAPVSGGHERAKPGTLTIIVGGDPAVYEACRPLLQTMGNELFYMGGTGTGMAAKLINNMLACVSVVVTAEALRLGKQAGIESATLIDMVSTASGSNYMLQRFKKVDRALHVGAYHRPGGNWNLLRKDVHLATDFARDQQIELPVTALVQEVYDALDFGPGKNPLIP